MEEEWGGDEEGGSAVMVVRNLSTKDSGCYKLKAKNQEGSAEAEVKVTVMGPPGKPVGPMEVSDVRKTSCRITWQRPENDGGAQVWSKEISSTTRIKCMRYFMSLHPFFLFFQHCPTDYVLLGGEASRGAGGVGDLRDGAWEGSAGSQGV